MTLRIEDSALLSDCRSAALVGSIDRVCFPRHDSASLFATLPGDASNGRWLIAPAARGSAAAVPERARPLTDRPEPPSRRAIAPPPSPVAPIMNTLRRLIEAVR